MKVALVHELLTMRGGAERVLRVLAEMFPQAPIYTLLYNEQKLGDWFPKERIRTSSLQQSARFSTNHHLYLNKFPRAVEAWNFDQFDLVISSSSAFAHGIITNNKPRHLCYVHSPARYLWDRTHDVLDRAGQGLLGPLKRRYLEKTFHNLRVWDAEVSDRPDRLVTASDTVKRRIDLYWRRQSTVINPPIDDFWFQSPSENSKLKTSGTWPDTALRAENYFLVVSTLTPYKRIDLAIDACNRLNRRLIIAGEGPALSSLKSLAGKTVEFAGYCEGEKLRSLYTNATATLFPGEEDFGLVPLESLACGTPVIAFNAGGAKETIEDGKTGVFFNAPTAESLAGAMEEFEKKTFDPAACTAAAAPHTEAAFRAMMETEIERVLQ